MTVNVTGRGRRRGSAATAGDAQPSSKPAPRRRGGAAQAAEALEPEAVQAPDPTTRSPLEALGSVGRLAPVPAPAPAAPAPAPSPVPEVPREAPAVLHPSDRRGYTPPPPPKLSVVPSHHQLAIGEIDQTLFDCPSCRRPLALGTRRCPGCGTRLIRSIPLAKAALFVVVGVLAGTIVGVGSSLVATAMGAAGGNAPLAAASQAPAGASSGVPASAGRSSAPTTDPTSNPSTGPMVEPIPAAARVALGQALEMNARLGVADAELRALLAAKRFDATAAAQTMRAISADMVFAEGVATRVSGWSGSTEVGAQLGTFYASVHETAGSALVNSVRNVTAYRAAARTMVQLLAGRAALDESIHATASAAGVSLPEPSTAP